MVKMMGHAGWEGHISTNLSSVEGDLFFSRSNSDLVALAVAVTERTDNVDLTPFPRLRGRGGGRAVAAEG